MKFSRCASDRNPKTRPVRWSRQPTGGFMTQFSRCATRADHIMRRVSRPAAPVRSALSVRPPLRKVAIRIMVARGRDPRYVSLRITVCDRRVADRHPNKTWSPIAAADTACRISRTCAQSSVPTHAHKDRAGRVASVESIPRKILLAAHCRAFDPAQASNRHHVGTRRHKSRSLFSECPVRFQQKPGW